MLDPGCEYTARKLWSYILRITVVLVVTSLAWSIIQFRFGVAKDGGSAGSFVLMILAGPYRMWYSWALLGVYLVTPILRQIVKARLLFIQL